MRILALTRYTDLAPSSRYRLYQYLPLLEQFGLDITISPFLNDAYTSTLYSKEKVSVTSIRICYLKQIRMLLKSKQFDLIWIQKEIFPWLPGWFDVLLTCGTPYVVDFDDAQFHRYDRHPSKLIRRFLGLKIDRLMRHAALIIAGNQYLAQRARDAGAPRVELLPTVIDLDRYPSESGVVDQVIGAFFLVRREMFEMLEGFDERFFVYFEEVDLSLRALQKGFLSYLLTSAQAFHQGGGSSEQVKSHRLFYSLHSRIKYGYKHFGWMKGTLLFALTLLIEPLSRIALALSQRSLEDAKAILLGYLMLIQRLITALLNALGFFSIYKKVSLRFRVVSHVSD